MKWPCILLASIISATPLIAAKPVNITPDMLLSMAPKEQRIRKILFRIVTANAVRCKKLAPQSGLLVRVCYGSFAPEMRAAQIAAFQTGKYPKAGLILPGSPAERAGLRDGDDILAVNGKSIASNLSEIADMKGWFKEVNALSAAWDAATIQPPTMLTIRRDGKEQSLALSAVMGCDMVAHLQASPQMNAATTTNHIWVNTGLLDSTPDDNELAFVIAHEAAHIILGHADAGKESDVKNYAIRRSMEIEADRLGVQLMADAGYDPYAAARFHMRWKKAGRGFLQKLTGGLNGPYMPPKERIAFLQKRAEEVDPDYKLAAKAD